MHAAVRHGTPSLTSLPKDGVVSCEVRPPMSLIRSLTSLDQAYLQSPEENCISHLAAHPSETLSTLHRHFLIRYETDIVQESLNCSKTKLFSKKKEQYWVPQNNDPT